MSGSNIDGLLGLPLLLAVLIFCQRRLHREMQAFFLVVTRSPAAAIVLFSLIFLPGVVLHEGSHFLMAWLLRVRTGRVSLLPQPLPDGKLQLGFVETASTDYFRDAWIGAAPLITGGLALAWIARNRLGMAPIGEHLLAGDFSTVWQGVQALPSAPDFWIWFYLMFAISSTFLPSASDRRAWLPFGLTFALLIGAAVLAGAGNWMMVNLAPVFNRGVWALNAVFAVSLAVSVLLWLPFWLLHRIATRITGFDAA